MLVLDLSQRVAVQLTPSGEAHLRRYGAGGYEMSDGLCIMPLGRLLFIFGGDHRRIGARPDFVNNAIRPTRDTYFNINDRVHVRLTPEGAQLQARRDGGGTNALFTMDGDCHTFQFYQLMFVFGDNAHVMSVPHRYFNGNLEVRRPSPE